MTKDGLLRRAQLVARLRHPNLAPMLPLPGGAGLTPVTNGAQRLADFGTTDGRVGGLELEQIIWLLLDVLSGLRALHELEIDGSAFVHGSISPQYVLLGEPGDARLVPVTSAHLTTLGVCETSGYAAPESLLGSVADLRADLFSVGVMLWEALAQRRLFPDGSCDAVVARLADAGAPALTDLVGASWALPLCQVAERAIAAAPAERFASALDLSRAIVAAVGPRLTGPHSEARAPRAAAATLEPTPRAAAALEPVARARRWRSATPLSLVIDLPPPPSEPAVLVESEPVPSSRTQPVLSPHWQRWQPVLAGLAALCLAFGAARLVPRKAPNAAQQPLATERTPVTEVASASPPSAPSLSASTALAPRPSASAALVQPTPKATPRKPRAKLHAAQQADGDYGI